MHIGVSKKTGKPIKPKKKQPKKPNRKKNRLNFWKNRSVRFRFYKKKPKKPNRTELNRNRQKTGKKNWVKPSQTEKTEPNQKNRAKTGKTEPNRFEPVFSQKNRTEPNQNRSVWLGFGFFSKKNFGLVTFFDKNQTEPKMITPKCRCKRYLSLIKCYQSNYIAGSSLHKITRLMGYKYIMRPSEQKFTIFILYCIYIFRASLSRI